MKLLPIILIILSSCNSETARPIPVAEGNTTFDSLIALQDSTNGELRETKASLTSTISEVKAQIAVLSAKKKAVEVQIGEQPTFMSMRAEDYKPSDDKDKEINRLRQQVRDYEREIAKLKNRLFYDSMNHVSKNYDVVPNEEKPDEKSLIITLDKKLKGDGDISETGVSVYIMKYTKDAKKLMKEYGNCQTKDLNLLQAKEANYYNGQYFFNDISPGKYLIKVCALFGNWMVINKTDYKQEIKMLMSPPIQ